MYPSPTSQLLQVAAKVTDITIAPIGSMAHVHQCCLSPTTSVVTVQEHQHGSRML